MRNTVLNKSLDRLLTPLQGRSVHFVKRDILISLIKHSRLGAAKSIQIGVDATALYDVLQVKICLSVAYEVNFFTDQFLHYFVAAEQANLLPAHLA